MLALVRIWTGPIVQILVHSVRREERLPVEETNHDPFRKFPATDRCKHAEQGNDYVPKNLNAKKDKSLLSEDFHARLVKIVNDRSASHHLWGQGLQFSSSTNPLAKCIGQLKQGYSFAEPEPTLSHSSTGSLEGGLESSTRDAVHGPSH